MISINLISKIKDIYSQLKVDYPAYNIELELRIGHFDKYNKFINGITSFQFNDLKHFYQSLPRKSKSTINYTNKNIRKVEDNNIITWEYKKKIWSIILEDYPVKISISLEKSVDPVSPFNPKMMRKKDRDSFLLIDNGIQLDTTNVQMTNLSTNNTTYNYEVELEILQFTFIDSINDILTPFFKKLYNTIDLYTQQEKNDIILYVNNTLNGWNNLPLESHIRKYSIDYRIYQPVRFINMNDLVWGGIIGNPNTSYVVTRKVVAKRHLLVFNSTHIWMIGYPNHVTKIGPNIYPELIGTILDGGYIMPQHRKNFAPQTLIWYVPYDCLSAVRVNSPSDRGDTYIQNNIFVDRLAYCQSVTDRYKDQLLYMTTRNYRELSSSDQSFSVIRQLLDGMNVLPFYNNGLIFIPNNIPYNQYDRTIPIYDRNLRTSPDICKWIDPNNIEMMVQWIHNHDNSVLYAINNETNKLVPIVDSLITTPSDPTIPSGSIVQYKWINHKLTMISPKYSIKYPYNYSEIQQILTYLRSPITLEIISGYSFNLMYQYHNQVISQLFTPSHKTILSIGSHQYIDFTKWNQFDNVYLFEMDVTIIPQLQFNHPNFTIKPANMENIQTISSSVSVVTLLYTLSPLIQDSTNLKQLLEIITSILTDDGKIIFLLLDGDTISHVFYPEIDNGYLLWLSKLKLGNKLISYEDPQYTNITIGHLNSFHYNKDDTNFTYLHINNQYLVFIDDITLYLSQYQWSLTQMRRGDGEKYMNAFENRYGGLHTYGVYTKI